MTDKSIPTPGDDPRDLPDDPSLGREEQLEEAERCFHCADETAELVFDQMCDVIDQSMVEDKITIDRGRYHDLVMAELHNMIRMALRDNGSISMVGEIR